MREGPFHVLTVLIAAATTAFLVAVAFVHLPMNPTNPTAPRKENAAVTPSPPAIHSRAEQPATAASRAEDVAPLPPPAGAVVAQVEPRPAVAPPAVVARENPPPAPPLAAPRAERDVPESTSSVPGPPSSAIGGPLVSPMLQDDARASAPVPAPSAAAAAVPRERHAERRPDPAPSSSPRVRARSEARTARRQSVHVRPAAHESVRRTRRAERIRAWGARRAARDRRGRAVVWRAPPPILAPHYLPPGALIIVIEPVR